MCARQVNAGRRRAANTGISIGGYHAERKPSSYVDSLRRWGRVRGPTCSSDGNSSHFRQHGLSFDSGHRVPRSDPAPGPIISWPTRRAPASIAAALPLSPLYLFLEEEGIRRPLRSAAIIAARSSSMAGSPGDRRRTYFHAPRNAASARQSPLSSSARRIFRHCLPAPALGRSPGTRPRRAEDVRNELLSATKAAPPMASLSIPRAGTVDMPPRRGPARRAGALRAGAKVPKVHGIR